MGVRIEVAVALVVGLSGCAGAQQASTTPATPRLGSARVPAPPREHVSIAGHLRAHDGSALREAELLVARQGWAGPPLTLALDEEGRFAVEVPAGVYRIAIDAPDHRASVRTTVLTADLRVEGRLRASARVEAGGAAQTPPLEWIGESPATTAMLDFHARWFPVVNELHHRMPRKENGAWDITDELREEARAHAARARAEVDAATDPATRALLLAVHVELFTIYCLTEADAPALRDDVGWILDHVSPVDLHWALSSVFQNFWSFMIPLAREGASAAFVASLDAWLERCAKEHPVPDVGARALGRLLFDAKRRGDSPRVAELEALGRDEHFGHTSAPPPRWHRPPRRGTLERGKPLSPFDFAALGDADRRVTSTDRSGRIYLLDIWSTTCGPCVADLPSVHAAYAAINGATLGPHGGAAGLRGLEPVASPTIEFVFVSVDDSEDAVETFRQESWSMPWTHAFVGHVGMSELWALWGVRSIPTTVLVDEHGTILEWGDALRGDLLLPTLERVLAERSADLR